MIELPGQRAAELEVFYSVGSDEFNELSYVSVLNGQPPAEDYESYYVSDK